jgi:hypothetical protein
LFVGAGGVLVEIFDNGSAVILRVPGPGLFVESILLYVIEEMQVAE